MVIETNYGYIEVLLFPEVAPKAVENFIGLAENGYYDNVSFHRLIPGFMIQGGNPTGTGAGGKSLWEKDFSIEVSKSVLFDVPGRLAMAYAGPHSNGSQFFITTVPTKWLNKKYTIYGQVVDGEDTVKKIESLGSRSGGLKSIQTEDGWFWDRTYPEVPRITRMFLK